MATGFLIALEGIDGAGKSTQANLLAGALRQRGFEVTLTREPTAGPVGRKLRRYLLGATRHLSPQEELDWFLADRREHVAATIKPALAAGHIVITDRYYYSSVAYQGALGLDPARILALNEVVAPRPDLVFILTLPPAQALARLSRPAQVSEAPDYLERVAALYAALQGPHIHRVNAAAPPESLHATLLRVTLEALERKDPGAAAPGPASPGRGSG
jgi:dTMP kinase